MGGVFSPTYETELTEVAGSECQQERKRKGTIKIKSQNNTVCKIEAVWCQIVYSMTPGVNCVLLCSRLSNRKPASFSKDQASEKKNWRKLSELNVSLDASRSPFLQFKCEEMTFKYVK